jgi:hypothetical protein
MRSHLACERQTGANTRPPGHNGDPTNPAVKAGVKVRRPGTVSHYRMGMTQCGGDARSATEKQTPLHQQAVVALAAGTVKAQARALAVQVANATMFDRAAQKVARAPERAGRNPHKSHTWARTRPHPLACGASMWETPTAEWWLSSDFRCVARPLPFGLWCMTKPSRQPHGIVGAFHHVQRCVMRLVLTQGTPALTQGTSPLTRGTAAT